jgi:Na+-transporting NADH:ubiquinone oxidoreductase subunit F
VTVNTSRRIDTRAGLKLLGILIGGGIPVPSPCGGVGRCGLCRVTVTEGGGAPLPTETNLIARRDLHQGMRLACQVVARGDLAVEVPEELFGVESWNCTVLSNRSMSPFIKELVLELPEGNQLDFTAGGFVQVTAPAYRLPFNQIAVDDKYRAMWDAYSLSSVEMESDSEVTRAYSLATIPSDDGCIVLNIRLALPPPGAVNHAKPGVVSSYLYAAKPGDTIAVSGPYGSFRAQDTDREMVFIGGGVGMAPLRAIIFDQLERQHTKRKISYWYGARSKIELFYDDAFNALQSKYENFTWAVALSDPTKDDAWEGPVGFIHNVVYDRYLKDHPAPEDCEYYLCGPPLMIDAVFAMLDDLGVERDHIFFDDFGS